MRESNLTLPSCPIQPVDRPRIHCRWLIRRDMPEVLDIEALSFTHHWTDEDFSRCLRQRNCIGMVAEVDERVLGFMVYELHDTRLHVINLAVHPQVRRQGVGGRLTALLIGKLSSHRRTRILLQVRETNLPAQLFFRALGFRAIAVLRNFYEDEEGHHEDAFAMEHRLAGAGNFPSGDDE